MSTDLEHASPHEPSSWTPGPSAFPLPIATPQHVPEPELSLIDGDVAEPPVLGATPSLADLAGLIRVQQWVKNLLLFVPLFTSHQFLDLSKVISTLLAFVAFGACVTVGHIFNDILDREADRQHPDKCKRPLAAGRISVRTAIGVALLAALLSATIATTLLPVSFLGVMVGYLALSMFYSYRLKEKLLVDVILLAGFYTYRVWAGAVVVDVTLSPWLLGFSIFLFFNLALLKRYADLQQAGKRKRADLSRRAYVVDDMEILRSLGPAAGYMSVLIMALYIHSETITELYRRPQILWLICPCLLYWLSRVWILAHRGQMTTDPIAFAIRDQSSYAVGGIMLLIFLGAI